MSRAIFLVGLLVSAIFLSGCIVPPTLCGNGVCERGETHDNCPHDCPLLGYDLAVIDMNISPEKPKVGDILEIQVTIKNLGVPTSFSGQVDIVYSNGIGQISQAIPGSPDDQLATNEIRVITFTSGRLDIEGDTTITATFRPFGEDVNWANNQKTKIVYVAPAALEKCIVPMDEMLVYKNTILCRDTYDLPNGIKIESNNIVLDCNRATLRGAGDLFSFGISLEPKSNVTIKNCNIQNYMDGIYLASSSDNNIFDNNLSNNRSGIVISATSKNNLIHNNTAKDNNVCGISLSDSSSRNVVTENITAYNLMGICLSGSLDNTVSKNVVTSNTYGVMLTGKGTPSNYNKFSDNNVSLNSYGIYVFYSNNNEFTFNTVNLNKEHGFYISSSSENTLTHNNINENKNGIYLVLTSQNNQVEKNNIFNNIGYNLANHQSSDTNATYNYWGTTDINKIKEKILDKFDNSSLGIVDFEPYLCSEYPKGTPSPCNT